MVIGNISTVDGGGTPTNSVRLYANGQTLDQPYSHLLSS
jgi:hypothetical protein